jgi:hypothetical protein
MSTIRILQGMAQIAATDKVAREARKTNEILRGQVHDEAFEAGRKAGWEAGWKAGWIARDKQGEASELALPRHRNVDLEGMATTNARETHVRATYAEGVADYLLTGDDFSVYSTGRNRPAGDWRTFFTELVDAGLMRRSAVGRYWWV